MMSVPIGETAAQRPGHRVPSRGHVLVIDSDWREVAGTALAFVEGFE